MKIVASTSDHRVNDVWWPGSRVQQNSEDQLTDSELSFLDSLPHNIFYFNPISGMVIVRRFNICSIPLFACARRHTLTAAACHR